MERAACMHNTQTWVAGLVEFVCNSMGTGQHGPQSPAHVKSQRLLVNVCEISNRALARVSAT